MLKTSRHVQRTLLVLAALVLHLAVLALLGGAAHAKGEHLRRTAAPNVAPSVHERTGSRLPPLIDLTPPEVRSLGRVGGGNDAFDLAEPVGVVLAYVLRRFDEPDPMRTGCANDIGLDRGRAPPRGVELHAI